MEPSNTIPSSQSIQIAKRYIHLVTKDSELAEMLHQQISHFGYYIHHVQGLPSLEKAISEQASLAILVDMESAILSFDGKPVSESLKNLKLPDVPLIFLSNSDGQEVRLEAVRQGGIAFFSKPIDIISLVDKLDEQNVNETNDPYRVLIVEDQVPVANYYGMVLKMAGMEARVVTEPSKALENLIEFHPDLILMDLYMPNIDGSEIAVLIRQMEEYVSIPIVFLSSEDDFNKHIEMMSLGSDDFLTKPIKAAHLVAIVKSRLERLKTLRTYMVRDSLTGLLNHTSFRGILSQEVNRCRRQNTRMALTMMDVDRFKRVNDTYGHAVGDSVLKGLSRLLKQRLRKSDIIGRYGGEEFVCLFLDAGPEEAYKIVDELRQHFSEIEFRPDSENVLSVTISAGIATFPEFSSAKELSDAADAAMYQAKALGRNKIVVASPELIIRK